MTGRPPACSTSYRGCEARELAARIADEQMAATIEAWTAAHLIVDAADRALVVRRLQLYKMAALQQVEAQLRALARGDCVEVPDFSALLGDGESLSVH
jgi:hypothetical protein